MYESYRPEFTERNREIVVLLKEIKLWGKDPVWEQEDKVMNLIRNILS